MGRRGPKGVRLKKLIPRAMQLVQAGKCKTITELCVEFGFSTHTWYNAVQRVKDANDVKTLHAIKELNDAIMKLWLNMGLSGKVPNSVWIFCMKNIFGWRDKRDLELSGNPDRPVKIDTMSEEDIKRWLAELEKDGY